MENSQELASNMTKREAFAMAAMRGELAAQTNRHHSDSVY